MTEHVSHMAEAQKILFWTDKRPIAPDLETKITCAIAEAAQAILGTLSALAINFILYNMTNEGANSGFGFLFIVFSIALFFMIRNPIGKRGGLYSLAYQSGIPLKRTRLSRGLIVLLGLIVSGILVALFFVIFPVPGGSNYLSIYQVEFLSIMMTVQIAYGAASSLEHLGWILDLRAQQGHQIPIKDHPMAAPNVVGNDWQEKPTP
ncbi:MAG TPA: hypothetical protein DIU09_00070 [Hyphomonadaceae bacterium]|nr:hypothetical protein AEM38_09240 [Hyphomonadaceae bacterium UKL13-1]HCP62962.1 hypothetical protein [Hyphomonadaceae bacterium]